MTGFPVTDDVYRKIHARWNEVERRLTFRLGSPVDPQFVLRKLQEIIDQPASPATVSPSPQRSPSRVRQIDESGVDLALEVVQLLEPTALPHNWLREAFLLDPEELIELPTAGELLVAYRRLTPIQRETVRLLYGTKGAPMSKAEVAKELGYANSTGVYGSLQGAAWQLRKAFGSDSFYGLNACPDEFRPKYSDGRYLTLLDVLLHTREGSRKEFVQKAFLSWLEVNDFPKIAGVLRRREALPKY